MFRALSVAGLALSVGWLWWLSRGSAEPWGIADIGALLAWVPMASVIALNEVTWLLWPLLVCTWSCWRRERWTPGAIAFGIALSLKPFLGVFLLWLAVTRRWRPAATAVAACLAAYGVAAAAYGVRVFPAWWRALDSVRWWWAPMNASLQGMIARTVAPAGAVTSAAPSWVAPLAVSLDVMLVAAALVRTRGRTIDESWTLLMATALLASPLGWIYYIWWVVPGVRPRTAPIPESVAVGALRLRHGAAAKPPHRGHAGVDVFLGSLSFVARGISPLPRRAFPLTCGAVVARAPLLPRARRDSCHRRSRRASTADPTWSRAARR